MKPDIHPDYRYVVFRDEAADFQFITRSTIQASQTIEVEGVAVSYTHLTLPTNREV